jgi:hypothetical protein
MPRAVLPTTTAPARPAEQPDATAAKPPPTGGAVPWMSIPNVLRAIRPVRASITAPRPENTAHTIVFPVPVATTYQQTTSATWLLLPSKVILPRPFKRVLPIVAAHAIPITAMGRSNGNTGAVWASWRQNKKSVRVTETARTMIADFFRIDYNPSQKKEFWFKIAAAAKFKPEACSIQRI